MKHLHAANEYSRPSRSAGRRLRRLLVLLAVVSGAFAVLAGAASAQAPVHIKRTLGPFTFDAPAGTLCDFAYHEESVVTQNLKRFFDDDGNLVRVELLNELTVLHQNADTGLTLIELVRVAVHADFVTGEVSTTGQNWHLRNEDGRLVLVGAGRLVTDLVTGEIISETPNFLADFAQTNCTALGGAPAV
jgi:hypothetical protein